MIDDTSEEFINRHIGPSKEDQLKMLDYIGSNSLKQLIKDTVPEIKWVMTGETKKIGIYNAYKATSTKLSQ